MHSEFASAMAAAASGLRAQTVRIRIASENIANARSTGESPGADPYRRKLPVFAAVLDRQSGVDKVRLSRSVEDKSEFTLTLDPSHPAADAEGYVKYPNVSTLIEMADLREAQRSYEANLNVIQNSKEMMMSMIRLLKA